MSLKMVDFETVITLQHPADSFLVENVTFRLSEFLERVREQYDESDVKLKWLLNGIECERLQPNQDWQSGKLKLVMIFTPEPVKPEMVILEEDFELNELRQIYAS